MQIAIVEDNRPLATGLVKAFDSDGHHVTLFHSGDQAENVLSREHVDLIILDINLPAMSGLDVLKSLRQKNIQTPVLLLTARSSLTDKVSGLDLGADDYLQKPFDLDELKARARALLRRSEKEFRPEVKIGQLEFEPNTRQLKANGVLMDIPRRELALIEILIQNKGRVISKSQILDHLYGHGSDNDETAVEVYIHRLRKRIAGTGAEVKTARGLGYCLRQTQ